jgi:T4 RnlA family RNA ligase
MTYDKALKIKNNSENFIEKKFNIKGLDMSIFCYHISTIKDFETNGKLDRDKLNMRSPLFIHKKGVDIYIPSLPKFFNINENEHTLYSKLKEKEIMCVQEKADGSLLMPILLNDEIIWRTQKSFDNEQTKMAKKYIEDNPKYEEFIRWQLDEGNIPFFELISPFNRIVVNYSETELRLLTIKGQMMGTGFPLTTKESFFNSIGIKTANVYDFTLEQLLEKQKTDTGIEGWVVYFADGTMVKIKTEEYFIKHKLAESIEREHEIIKLFLDEKIDDVLTQLDEITEKEKRKLIIDTCNKVENIISDNTKEVLEGIDFFKKELLLKKEVKEIRKIMAKQFKTTKTFGVLMSMLSKLDDIDFEEILYQRIKDKLLFDTRTLSMARKVLKTSLFC